MCVRQHGDPIPTQTEIPLGCDIQVQANIPQESESIPPLVPTPTIKEEIAMPNIPSSSPQNPAKKRKRRNESSISTSSAGSKNIDPINISSPPQATGNGTKDKSNNDQATGNISSENPLNNSQPHIGSSIDDSILNSEIYQIYCQAEDPGEAMQQIKQLKTCILFKIAIRNFSFSENEFERISKSALSKLWKEDSPLADSQFDRLKYFIKVTNFINGTIEGNMMGWSGHGKSMQAIFDYCLTKIQILNPNGYEYFYVANFKKGPGSSKWYRAVSSEFGLARRLAQLKVLGITDSTLNQFQFNHYLAKNSTNIKWLDFAQRIINGHQDCLVRGRRDIGVLPLSQRFFMAYYM